mgnify:CR=1 FL=1
MKGLSMKNKVLIYAYTKYNLGDDLLIKILSKRYPYVQFILYTYPEYKSIFKDCLNIHIISNRNILGKAINAIGRLVHRNNAYERSLARKCRACICITGSLFIQGEEWQSYLKYMKSRQITGIPYFQIGSNFGPYTDKKFYERFKEFFMNCEDVCFRELYSYNLFSDLPNVRFAPDIVFSGKFPIRKSEKMVSVSVINLKDRKELSQYQVSYKNYMTNLCRYYCNKGYQVNLMSFCKEEGDEIMVKEIMQEFKRKAVKPIPVFYQGDIGQIVDLISRSEIVVATRFHAMILGWCMEKKVLPIVYSAKMEHVINEVNFEGEVVHIRENKSDIESVLEQLRDYDKFDICEIRKKAENQFEKIDKLLLKR